MPVVPIKILQLQPEITDAQRLYDMLNSVITQQRDKIFNWIEVELRTNVQPPIKGEITQGKLRWRGISLGVTYVLGRSSTYTILQRGEPIGQTLTVEYNIGI